MSKIIRDGVTIVLLNEVGRLWCGERCDVPNAWQLPQGGIDAGENVEEAAKRELYEETGIVSTKLLGFSQKSYEYLFPDNVLQEMRHKYGNIRWHGQRQKFCFMQFCGDESEIRLDIEHPEFRRWKWMTVDELLNAIVSFKKKMYSEAFSDCSNLLSCFMSRAD